MIVLPAPVAVPLPCLPEWNALIAAMLEKGAGTMNRPRKAGRAWSRLEDQRLTSLQKDGVPLCDIAIAIGRSPNACLSRATLLRKFAAMGRNPYDTKRGPAPAPVVRRTPRPFNEPGSNEIGCRKLHEAHMRVHGGWKVAA